MDRSHINVSSPDLLSTVRPFHVPSKASGKGGRTGKVSVKHHDVNVPHDVSNVAKNQPIKSSTASSPLAKARQIDIPKVSPPNHSVFSEHNSKPGPSACPPAPFHPAPFTGFGSVPWTGPPPDPGAPSLRDNTVGTVQPQSSPISADMRGNVKGMESKVSACDRDVAMEEVRPIVADPSTSYS